MRHTKEKKNVIIAVRVSEKEKKAIEKKAEKSGRSVSEMIVDALKKT